MKTKPILALAMGAVLLTALTVSVNAAPTTIAGIISIPGLSKAKDGKLKHTDKSMKSGRATVGVAETHSGDPEGYSPPLRPPWSFNAGGNTNAKHLGSLGVDFRSPTALLVPGFGYGRGNQMAGLSGVGNANGTTPGKGTTPNMVPRPTHPVPEGGATALLLGFSVLGFGLLKRKSAAR